MRIRATTRLLAVIGDPVRHSLSPAMHNAAITALGLDAAFLALRASADTFEALVRSLVAGGAAVCVTVPHKLAAARLLDAPSALVRRTGACNAVWADGSAIAGDNTDVEGIAAEVARLSGGRAPSGALVLGTGGAARAAAVAIRETWPAADLAVGSRDAARAGDFVRWAATAGVRCREGSLGRGETCELVVNATPLGLKPDDPLPLDPGNLGHGPAVALLDLVYAPGETALVRQARQHGVRAADGRGVLVAQGAAAFARFFGVPGPVEVMRAAVEDALRA
jgi:shikimate dehydrogenase